MKRYSIIFIIPLLLFIGIAYFLWEGLLHDPHKINSPLIDKSAPVFSLKTIASNTPYFSNQQLQGHISLLNIWASWCLACRSEQPILMDIAHSNEVAIYGIAYKDSAQDVQKWLNELGNPYQIIGLDREGKVAIDWGVYGTPETFLIDQHGIIRYKHIGPLTKEVWRDKLRPMIKKIATVQ